MNLHEMTVSWNFSHEEEYSIPYSFLEKVFNSRAIEEGVISPKQNIRIKKIDSNDGYRILNLNTEIYRLMEN